MFKWPTAKAGDTYAQFVTSHLRGGVAELFLMKGFKDMGSLHILELD